jgi:hypothetical protein
LPARELSEFPARVCDNVRCVLERPYRTAAQALLVILFAVCVFRAFTQCITYDEALTWDEYLNGPFSWIFHKYDANHHFLNTLLMGLSIRLFGLSEWSMRLPALAGAALYFASCYRLARTAFGDGASMLLAVALLTLNPVVLDFMVAARGYGLALALWTCAASVALDAFSRQSFPPRQMALAGAALALSVTANLVYVIPVSALAGMIFFVLACQQPKSAPPPARNVRKHKATAAPSPQTARRDLRPLVWFVLSIAAVSVLFLNLAPLEAMRSEHFYSGAATVRESLHSLAWSSLEHSGPLRQQPWIHGLTDAVAYAIAPLILIAALAVGIWRRASLLILAAGTAVFSAVVLLLIRLLLDKPYPAERMGIYFLPLVVLALVGLAHAGRDQKGLARPASIAAYAVAVLLAVLFLSEFNTRKFLVWEYDADTREMGDYLASHRPPNLRAVRVGGSWQLQESLFFYANLRKWDWIELHREQDPAAGLDYYALTPWDRLAVEQHLSLKEIYRGPVSGSALCAKK